MQPLALDHQHDVYSELLSVEVATTLLQRSYKDLMTCFKPLSQSLGLQLMILDYSDINTPADPILSSQPSQTSHLLIILPRR